MFTKLFLISAISTGALGTGVATGITPTGVAPTGIEFAAGPIRIKTGNGKFITAHMAEHTPLTLTVNLQGERRLLIKF
ncbi:MAG: hypothetical protein L3J05_00470 [Robiginitomaculum sp.]|nr:hypothetical protein [Robiginitomaculum sp.]